MTPLQVFFDKYQNCQKCELHKCRSKVVFARGRIPAEICFIGEAPGYSENALGEPFVGPAGKLLDQIVSESGADRYRIVITNLVMCLPLGPVNGELIDPDHDHITACRERLVEFVDLASPKLVVTIGRIAEEYLDKTWKDRIRFRDEIPIVNIVHPAWIIRQKDIAQPLAIRKCIATIRDAIHEIFKGDT